MREVLLSLSSSEIKGAGFTRRSAPTAPCWQGTRPPASRSATSTRGGNSVLVSLGSADGHLSRRAQFFVGTHPVGLTIADVNGDGVRDLVVANQGSNDVSLLLGQGRGDAWTLTQGPRLQAGQGP